MKKLISRFTMKCLRHLFNDKISGLGVYEYQDKYGDKYMANHPFYPWSFRTYKIRTMKQTAVEWYNLKVIELMTQREQENNIDVLEFRNQLDLLLTQAKEMEKAQIIDANWEASKDTNRAEQYYNETYKSE